MYTGLLLCEHFHTSKHGTNRNVVGCFTCTDHQNHPKHELYQHHLYQTNENRHRTRFEMSACIFKPPEKNWQPLRTSLQWLCSKGSLDIIHKVSACEPVPVSDAFCIRGANLQNHCSLPPSLNPSLYTEYLLTCFTCPFEV